MARATKYRAIILITNSFRICIIFSYIRVMISHEVLKWKLEMHIEVKNTQYLFWVEEGEEANTPHIFPHHPVMP